MGVHQALLPPQTPVRKDEGGMFPSGVGEKKYNHLDGFGIRYEVFIVRDLLIVREMCLS